jgi:hypothetical protein
VAIDTARNSGRKDDPPLAKPGPRRSTAGISRGVFGAFGALACPRCGLWWMSAGCHAFLCSFTAAFSGKGGRPMTENGFVKSRAGWRSAVLAHSLPPLQAFIDLCLTRLGRTRFNMRKRSSLIFAGQFCAPSPWLDVGAGLVDGFPLPFHAARGGAYSDRTMSGGQRSHLLVYANTTVTQSKNLRSTSGRAVSYQSPAHACTVSGPAL